MQNKKQKDKYGVIDELILEKQTQPKESWEKRFTDEFGIHFNSSGELQFAIAFISEELEKEYERGRHDNIIDISTWKNLGEKRGYDKFFEKKKEYDIEILINSYIDVDDNGNEFIREKDIRAMKDEIIKGL